jgi:DNA polymerase-3 subunit epsilon
MSKPWWRQPITPFDLETSGVRTREDRIVTGFVGVLDAQAMRVRVDARVLVDPGVPIPAEATAVHGITDAMVQAKGAPPADSVYAITKALADSLKARIPVVGMNVSFDLSMLYWECLRHGVPTLAEMLGYHPAAPVGPVIDALVLDKHVDTFRKGSRKLDDHPEKGPGLATYYGVPLTEAHNAQADAIAAALVAVRIAEKYGMGGDITDDAAALHGLQKFWAVEQRISLERYLRRKNPATTLDRCWPLCTDPNHPSG